MNRRLLTILLPLGAIVLSGCATFSDNDAIARVDNTELSSETLRDRLDAVGAPQGEVLDGEGVRQEISLWIQEQTAAGADATKAPEAYARGLGYSGTICVQAAVIEGATEVEASLAELEAGGDFATIFAARNIDQSLTDDGRLGCIPASELPFGQGNPFVDSLQELNAKNPLVAAQLPTSETDPEVFVLSRFVPYDELGPDDTPVIVANLSAQAMGIDVHVDPRYGTFDPSTGTVVALR